MSTPALTAAVDQATAEFRDTFAVFVDEARKLADEHGRALATALVFEELRSLPEDRVRGMLALTVLMLAYQNDPPLITGSAS